MGLSLFTIPEPNPFMQNVNNQRAFARVSYRQALPRTFCLLRSPLVNPESRCLCFEPGGFSPFFTVWP